MEYLNEQTKLEHPECRCDTPNNIGASNIRPNTPDPNIACPTPICPNPMRLWVIKYAITGTAKFIGQAVVQAPTIEQAQCIFGKDSRFNGYVDRLKITCCHEVFPHPEPILLQEDCVAIIDRRNLKTYPFVLKSDFDRTMSDLYADIAKAIRDSWERYRREFKIEVYNGLQGDNYITITPTEDYEQCYITHAESGVTAGEYGDILEEQQESQTPDFGDSVKIMSLIVDSQGHITEIEDHLVTIPDTEATQSLHGLMSATDKKKLDEIGINTNNSTALTPASELFDSVANNNVIQLHKISKTGTFSDLLNIPDGILTINYPKGDGTTETKTFTDNADTNETVTIPSEIDDTSAQNYKTYSSSKIENFVNSAIGKGTLIIQKNGTDLPVNYSVVQGVNLTKQAFGANDFNYCTVNIPIPTKVSELFNDGTGELDNEDRPIYPFITKAVNNLENYYTESEINNMFSQLESNIDWKEAVNTYADIVTTYPNPQDGWTVNVKDTDYTYRFNGTGWVAISANAIPLATQSVNGLMSSTDKTKLDGIEAGAEVNVQSDWNQTNTLADDYIKNKPTIQTLTAGNGIDITASVISAKIDNDTIQFNSDGEMYCTNTNNLKQVDCSTYQGEAGEIVQHIGTTSGDLVNGYVYKEVNLHSLTYGGVTYTYDGETEDDVTWKLYNLTQDNVNYVIPTFSGNSFWSVGDFTDLEVVDIFTIDSIAENDSDTEKIVDGYTDVSGELINVELDFVAPFSEITNTSKALIYKNGNDYLYCDSSFKFFASSIDGNNNADVIPFDGTVNDAYEWERIDVQPEQQLPTLGDLASINTNGDTTKYLRGDGTWNTIPSSVTIWEGTLAQYNQISPKDPNTIYLISD